MKLKLLFSIILVISFARVIAQSKFNLAPYTTIVTNVKDGLLEAGAQFEKDTIWHAPNRTLNIKPYFRVPLSDKDANLVKLDRFTDTWRFITAFQQTNDKTSPNGSTKRNSIVLQVEYGHNDFKFYPSGVKTDDTRSENSKNSFASELKLIWFRKKKSSSWQFATQARMRYSHEWKNADEVGVVQSANSNGVLTIKSMVIDEPKYEEILSPAFSFPFYPNSGNFSFAPTIYYDMAGDKENTVFNGLQRFRIEAWVFFHPTLEGTTNLKIGITPFASIRTNGKDDLRKNELGGQLTVKFNTTFLQFF